jgi:signal transduction histidine kinase/3D (Asp-Asp-Asp) domain-containing protein
MLRRGRNLTLVAYAQLLTDQLTWTAMVYISGGVTSGSTSLYGLTCVSGAIVVGTSGALFAAGAGMLSYVGMVTAFAWGWLGPPMDQVADAYVVDPQQMVYPAFSTLMATALVAAMASFLAERLKVYGGRLEAVTKRAEQAERLAALGRLAAALAHEIRNPLGSIKGSIELMRTGADMSHEDKQLCEIIEREAERLNDLVTDMVDLSRPREPERFEVDLAQIAASVVDLARGSARGDQVAIHYQGPDELTIMADPSQMRQVLWNLVRNAMQASDEGAEVVVAVVREDEGDVTMSVHDDGPGIAPSKRDHIFDAFFTTRSHGVGIGLAVVKQVADAHGFEVAVESELGHGTRVTLRMPKIAVVAAVALALTDLGCGGRDWVRGDDPELWWGDDAAASAEIAAPAPPPRPGTPTSAAARASVALEGPPIEKYRNTYYDFPQEQGAGGAAKELFDNSCKLIRSVPGDFHDALCVQGSGRLATGETVSFARRDCECALDCPRTAQKICFDVLDRGKFPYGRGAAGTAITPLRSVAVDTKEIPLGTVLYMPEFHGLRGPDGKAHDGCFIAEDRGLKVVGKHVDVFAGSPTTTKAWNQAVPSNDGVTVIIGASRCDHLRKR